MLISRVLLVGCGGIGGLLAEPLARLLAYHENGREARLTLADGDRYEAGNASRQRMAPEDRGRLKASCLGERVAAAGLAPPLVRAVYLGREGVAAWLRDGTGPALLVLAVDNNASHRDALVAMDETLSEAPDVVLVRPGNGAGTRWGLASVSVHARRDGVALTCDPRLTNEDIREPADAIPGHGCQARAPSEPQRIAANAMAAAWTLAIVSAVLDGRAFPDTHVCELGDGLEIPGQAWRSGPAGPLVSLPRA